MATQTTNYSLVKPTATETIDVSQINGNMEIIDAAMAGLQTELNGAVKVTAQTLTDAEKTQAKTNIGVPASVEVLQSNVYRFGGGLIIQTMNITKAKGTTETLNFPATFPNEVIAVIPYGRHVTSTGGYASPCSLQATAVNTSQCMVFMDSASEDPNASMSVKVVAIGY